MSTKTKSKKLMAHFAKVPLNPNALETLAMIATLLDEEHKETFNTYSELIRTKSVALDDEEGLTQEVENVYIALVNSKSRVSRSQILEPLVTKLI